jgi:transcription initiation factor TFIIIB Brf1 subunit/transcription initiation factor TFIIB
LAADLGEDEHREEDERCVCQTAGSVAHERIFDAGLEWG